MIAEDKKLTVSRLNTSLVGFETDTSFGKPSVEEEVFEFDSGEKHPGVLNAFAKAILEGTPLLADGEEGINGLTLSNAMHLSAFIGKAVELPFDEDLYYEELMKRVKTSRRKEAVKSAVANTEGTY